MVRFGYSQILDYFLRNDPTSFYENFSGPSSSLPTLASRLGSPATLEWWKNNLPNEYDEHPLDYATRSGHIDVLEWWKNSGLELKIGLVMNSASSAGQVQALEWWLCSGLDFKYDYKAFVFASAGGHVDVLDWWKESGLKVIPDAGVLTAATKANRANVLEWWRQSGYHPEYLLCDIWEALEEAYIKPVDVKRWWMAQGLEFGGSNEDWLRRCQL